MIRRFAEIKLENRHADAADEPDGEGKGERALGS